LIANGVWKDYIRKERIRIPLLRSINVADIV
jgi:hypothetical protein